MAISRLVIAAAGLAWGCAPRVTGTVKDATSGQPIAGASVELGSSGWGVRNNQVVWDAEKFVRTRTDTHGRFRFEKSGGTSLSVTAPGHGQVMTSLCARSPMTVRVGGPYPALRADRRLWIGSDGRVAADTDRRVSPVSVDALGITVSGTAFTGGHGLRVAAPGGVRLVRGTGTIPAPPLLPLDRVVELDLRQDCGWLFVGDGTSAVLVIQVAPLGWEEAPGMPRRWVMLYALLPS